MEKIRVGLHGSNGHHIISNLIGNLRAELVAFSAWDAEIPAGIFPKRCASLDGLLKEPGVDLVSLCSPRRRDQARDAVACLDAGKHVYAEKPCAMTKEDLDGIMSAARSSGRIFHEMADTAFCQPFLAMRKIVAQGTIGMVVQVFVQKSYPLGNGRPLDEDVDGGTRTRLVLSDRDMGTFSTDEPSMDYFEMFMDEVQGVRPMPVTIEEELHPLRVLIQAERKNPIRNRTRL